MSLKYALLVDDSKSARFALRALLQRNGFEVETAESAESALERVRHSRPDAIFMDHMMPGMDGYAATVLLKNDPMTAHIPIVMCTSNDQAEYVRKAKDIGALGILPKPATAEKLSEILDALDREIAGSGALAPMESRHPVEPPSPSQDADAALHAASLDAVCETVEPLIEQEILSQMQKLREEILAQSLTVTQEAIQRSLQTASSDWRAEALDEVRSEANSHNATNQQRSADQLDIQIRQLSTELRTALDDRFGTLKSELLNDSDVRASIRAQAIASAEDLAHKIATEQATKAAKESAETLSVALSRRTFEEFEPKFARLARKINLFAAGAALIGLLAALTAYFF